MSAEEAVITVAPNVRETPSSPRGVESPWLWLAVLFALNVAVPFLPVPNRWVALGGALTVMALHVTAIVLFSAHATRLQLPAARQAVLLAACLALWACSLWGVKPLLESIFRAADAAKTTPSLWLRGIGTINYSARPLALLGASVFGGALVARLIKSPNMLGPICGAVALIDFWGVLLGGPVAQMLEKAPSIAKTAMSSVPSLGAATHSAHKFNIPELQIGAGDYLFLGLLFAALHYNNMNWRGSVKLTIPLVALTLFGTTWIGNLPGLVPIGIGIALPNLKYFQFTREENFAMLWAGLLVIGLSIGAYFGVQKMLPEKPKPISTERLRHSPGD